MCACVVVVPRGECDVSSCVCAASSVAWWSCVCLMCCGVCVCVCGCARACDVCVQMRCVLFVFLCVFVVLVWCGWCFCVWC